MDTTLLVYQKPYNESPVDDNISAKHYVSMSMVEKLNEHVIFTETNTL